MTANSLLKLSELILQVVLTDQMGHPVVSPPRNVALACLAVSHLDDDEVGLVAAQLPAPARGLLAVLRPPASAAGRGGGGGGGGGGGEHGHLVAPPPLPADGHRAAQREEVGQLGQRQEAEAGAEADEAAEGGCGKIFRIWDRS